MQCSSKKCGFFQFVGQYWLFCVTALLAIFIWVTHLNQLLFYTINSWHVVLPTVVWNVINHITYTKYGVLPILLVIITFMFRRDKLALVILIYLINFGLLSIIKSLVHEARPFIVLPQDTFFWVQSAEDAIKNAYKSFPSGHTGNAAAFVFILFNLFFKIPAKAKELKSTHHVAPFVPSHMLSYSKIIKVLLFLFLILTGFSRICTGWHYPLDVLCAGLITFVIVNGCFYFIAKPK